MRYLLLVFILCSCASNSKIPWEKVEKPSPGASESIGYYSAGCLAGGKSLKTYSPFYYVMKPSRKRYYGHPKLLSFLIDLGRDLKRSENKIMLLGDLSQPKGGPMIYAHASHQIGLDVDIWFRMVSKEKVLTLEESENWAATSYVAGENLTDDWHGGIEKMIQLSAQDKRVQRVLVNPVVKKHFCHKYPGKQWMRKIRAWYGHDDHAHVRLYCDKKNPYCEPQSDPPIGDGCDENLEWWFTEEAKLEALNHRKDPETPKLPAKCHELL